MKYSKKTHINKDEVIASLQNVGIIVEYGNSRRGVVAYGEDGKVSFLSENYTIFSDNSQTSNKNEYLTISQKKNDQDALFFQSKINGDIIERKIDDQTCLAA